MRIVLNTIILNTANSNSNITASGITIKIKKKIWFLYEIGLRDANQTGQVFWL